MSASEVSPDYMLKLAVASTLPDSRTLELNQWHVDRIVRHLCERTPQLIEVNNKAVLVWVAGTWYELKPGYDTRVVEGERE